MRALTITVWTYGGISCAEGIHVGFRPDVWPDRFVLLGTWQPPATPVRVPLSHADLDALVPVGPCPAQGKRVVFSSMPGDRTATPTVCHQCGTPYEPQEQGSDQSTRLHPLAGSTRSEKILRASVAWTPEGAPVLVTERPGDEDLDLVYLMGETQQDGINFEMLDGAVGVARGERLRERSLWEVLKHAIRRGWHASLPPHGMGFDVLATTPDGGKIAVYIPNLPHGGQARLTIRRMGDYYRSW